MAGEKCDSPDGGGGGVARNEDDGDSWDEQAGWWTKTKLIVKHCTVEPLIAFYMITNMMTGLCTQNLNLQKACRVNLGLDNDTCYALENRVAAGLRDGGIDGTNNKTDVEVAVQKLVADTMMWKSVLISGVPLLLLVFVGSWSDRHGRRKPFILLPIASEMLAIVGLLLCTYYFYELPIEVTGLAETLLPALSGGWSVFFLAVFSYISDMSSVKFRTLRIGIANLFIFVAMPIGSALSGILFQMLGYYGVYTLSLSLHFLTLIYGIVFIKEKRTEVSSVVESKEPSKNTSTSCLHFIEDFFSLDSIKDAIRVTFKDGEQNRKLKIISLMVLVIVVSGPFSGEISIFYMYTRKQFGWNEVDYSYFATYSMITNLLGSLFSVVVLSHMLDIHDALIGTMSCTSKIMGGLVYAFATTEFVFYLGPLVEIINGTSFIAMRSIISKLVLGDELGKVNSIFGVCEAIAPVIYAPMYSILYKATLITFPGLFFLVGSALTLPAVIIFLLMYIDNKNEKTETCENKNDGVNDLENNSSSHKSDLKA